MLLNRQCCRVVDISEDTIDLSSGPVTPANTNSKTTFSLNENIDIGINQTDKQPEADGANVVETRLRRSSRRKLNFDSLDVGRETEEGVEVLAVIGKRFKGGKSKKKKVRKSRDNVSNLALELTPTTNNGNNFLGTEHGLLDKRAMKRSLPKYGGVGRYGKSLKGRTQDLHPTATLNEEEVDASGNRQDKDHGPGGKGVKIYREGKVQEKTGKEGDQPIIATVTCSAMVPKVSFNIVYGEKGGKHKTNTKIQAKQPLTSKKLKSSPSKEVKLKQQDGKRWVYYRVIEDVVTKKRRVEIRLSKFGRDMCTLKCPPDCQQKCVVKKIPKRKTRKVDAFTSPLKEPEYPSISLPEDFSIDPSFLEYFEHDTHLPIPASFPAIDFGCTPGVTSMHPFNNPSDAFVSASMATRKNPFESFRSASDGYPRSADSINALLSEAEAQMRLIGEDRSTFVSTVDFTSISFPPISSESRSAHNVAPALTWTEGVFSSINNAALLTQNEHAFHFTSNQGTLSSDEMNIAALLNERERCFTVAANERFHSSEASTQVNNAALLNQNENCFSTTVNINLSTSSLSFLNPFSSQETPAVPQMHKESTFEPAVTVPPHNIEPYNCRTSEFDPLSGLFDGGNNNLRCSPLQPGTFEFESSCLVENQNHSNANNIGEKSSTLEMDLSISSDSDEDVSPGAANFTSAENSPRRSSATLTITATSDNSPTVTSANALGSASTENSPRRSSATVVITATTESTPIGTSANSLGSATTENSPRRPSATLAGTATSESTPTGAPPVTVSIATTENSPRLNATVANSTPTGFSPGTMVFSPCIATTEYASNRATATAAISLSSDTTENVSSSTTVANSTPTGTFSVKPTGTTIFTPCTVPTENASNRATNPAAISLSSGTSEGSPIRSSATVANTTTIGTSPNKPSGTSATTTTMENIPNRSSATAVSTYTTETSPSSSSGTTSTFSCIATIENTPRTPSASVANTITTENSASRPPGAPAIATSSANPELTLKWPSSNSAATSFNVEPNSSLSPTNIAALPTAETASIPINDPDTNDLMDTSSYDDVRSANPPTTSVLKNASSNPAQCLKTSTTLTNFESRETSTHFATSLRNLSEAICSAIVGEAPPSVNNLKTAALQGADASTSVVSSVAENLCTTAEDFTGAKNDSPAAEDISTASGGFSTVRTTCLSSKRVPNQADVAMKGESPTKKETSALFPSKETSEGSTTITSADIVPSSSIKLDTTISSAAVTPSASIKLDTTTSALDINCNSSSVSSARKPLRRLSCISQQIDFFPTNSEFSEAPYSVQASSTSANSKNLCSHVCFRDQATAPANSTPAIPPNIFLVVLNPALNSVGASPRNEIVNSPTVYSFPTPPSEVGSPPALPQVVLQALSSYSGNLTPRTPSVANPLDIPVDRNSTSGVPPGSSLAGSTASCCGHISNPSGATISKEVTTPSPCSSSKGENHDRK